MRRILAGPALLMLTGALGAWAQNRCILQTSAGNGFTLAKQQNLTVLGTFSEPGFDLYLVQTAGNQNCNSLHGGGVQDAESNTVVNAPEKKSGGGPHASSVVPPTPPSALPPKTSVTLYGLGLAWTGYTNQTAGQIIEAAKAQQSFNSGNGTVVALIDTGVDFFHPALAGSLISGWDYTSGQPGGSAYTAQSTSPILDQSTSPILDQSTSPILDQSTSPILDQSTSPILDQSTTAILDQSTSPILDTPTNDSGHGTMVSGLIHLVAPWARIMPVRVFNASGSASLYNVIRGIYYAVDHGAKVLNMSFSIDGNSQALTAAINYAISHGVICVASAGNESTASAVYPASIKGVNGVGATTNLDQLAWFSNFGGADTDVYAPGVWVITTYPSGQYAEGCGTSFSAPLVAGAAAILESLEGGNLSESQGANALSSGVFLKGLGDRLDVFDAGSALQSGGHGGH